MRTRLVNQNETTEGTYIVISRPSKWGSPYISGRDGDKETIQRKYEQYFGEQLRASPMFKKEILTLKGKILACTCDDLKLCHGSVIIKYLNSIEPNQEVYVDKDD